MRLTALKRQDDAHGDDIWACKWVEDKTQTTGAPASGGGGGGLRMLTGSCDETFNLWGYTDENGLTQELTSTGQDLGVVSMDVSPTGEFGATSSLDCVIRLVRIKTKEVEQIATIELPAPETWQVAYHPDPSREILGVAAGCVGGLRLYKSGVLDDGLKREICHIGPKVRQSEDRQKLSRDNSPAAKGNPAGRSHERVDSTI